MYAKKQKIYVIEQKENKFYKIYFKQNIEKLNVLLEIPSEFRTKQMGKQYFHIHKNNINSMFHIPDDLKTEAMCNEYFEIHTNYYQDLRWIDVILQAIPEIYRNDLMCELYFQKHHNLDLIPYPKITKNMLNILDANIYPVSVISRKKISQIYGEKSKVKKISSIR